MSNGFVKSAARVMAIFECFEDVKRPLTISELVRLMGVPQSSMSALMKSLLSQGFVDYDVRSRAYTPSVRVGLLGNWLMGGPQNQDNLLTMLQDLNSTTGDTVILGVLNGVEAQYIHVVNSYQRLRFQLRPGMLRPMFRTAIGLVLASQRDDAEIGRMIRRVNTETERPEDAIQVVEVISGEPHGRARDQEPEGLRLRSEDTGIWPPELRQEREDRQDINSLGPSGKVQAQAQPTPLGSAKKKLGARLFPEAVPPPGPNSDPKVGAGVSNFDASPSGIASHEFLRDLCG